MSERKLRILAVSTHPHDWTWFSGTLGIHVQRGDQVTVCIVTHGGATHREKWLDELRKPEAERDPAVINEPIENYIEQKANEMRQAAALFGVTDVRMLNFPDKPFLIERYPEAIDRITDLILDVRPNVIIAESPFSEPGMPSRHRDDHTEVGIATMEAKQRAERPRAGSLVPPHSVAVTFWPGVYFDRSQVDFVVELSGEWFEKRVQAEAFYESQGHDEVWARRRMEIDIGHMGQRARTRYGEGFVREKPELLTHLPVPELMLQQAEEGSLEHIARLTGKRGVSAR